VIGTRAGPFVAGKSQDLFLPSVGMARIPDRQARSDSLALLALSPDHRLLAHAFSREVQLYDADTATPIGPPLQSDGTAMDVITQLAFSPDSKQLLARTVLGRWLLWPIASEQRNTAELNMSLARLSVDNENQQAVLVPSTGERAALRARDPGPWRSPDARPVPTAAARTVSGEPIPMRARDTSPLLLDLGSHFDFAPETLHNRFYSILPTMRPMPLGVQRIAGAEFDLRGMMQVGGADQFGNPSKDAIITCLPLPPLPMAALHVLFTASTPTPLPTGHTVANVILHFADDSQASLPIRAGQEVSG